MLILFCEIWNHIIISAQKGEIKLSHDDIKPVMEVINAY